MLGAIFTAMSGMSAYSDGLQTISNNVANLNTTGYKEQFVSFGELVNAGEQSYPGADAGPGGFGVEMDTPTTDYSQGQLSETTNGLDLAIQGNGFLAVVNDGSLYYQRTGSFSVNPNGYITDSSGSELTVLNAENQPEVLNISSLEVDPPAATTTITLANNLSSSGTSAEVSDITVHDSAGGSHDWTVALSNPQADSSGTGTDWTVTVTDSGGSTVGTGTITFVNGTAQSASDTVTVTDPVSGASGLTVKLDFSAVTSYSAGTTSTLSAQSVDGNAMGTQTGVTVDGNAAVQIAYSNGQTKSAGTVAIANIEDPQQLQLVNHGLYRMASDNPMQYSASGTAGTGTLESSELEQSNVNLSDEFGELIMIERGYQACTEVVSISNDLIQSLFGIQGQGAG